MQTVKSMQIFNAAEKIRQDGKSPSFWLQRLAAHPCCLLPVISGGSLRLFDAHILWLELLFGAVFVVGIEESVCAAHAYYNRTFCDKGYHASRLTSYMIAVPLFLGTFILAHALFPHDPAVLNHLHEHSH